MQQTAPLREVSINQAFMKSGNAHANAIFPYIRQFVALGGMLVASRRGKPRSCGGPSLEFGSDVQFELSWPGIWMANDDDITLRWRTYSLPMKSQPQCGVKLSP